MISSQFGQIISEHLLLFNEKCWLKNMICSQIRQIISDQFCDSLKTVDSFRPLLWFNEKIWLERMICLQIRQPWQLHSVGTDPAHIWSAYKPRLPDEAHIWARLCFCLGNNFRPVLWFPEKSDSFRPLEIQWKDLTQKNDFRHCYFSCEL